MILLFRELRAFDYLQTYWHADQVDVRKKELRDTTVLSLSNSQGWERCQLHFAVNSHGKIRYHLPDLSDRGGTEPHSMTFPK